MIHLDWRNLACRPGHYPPPDSCQSTCGRLPRSCAVAGVVDMCDAKRLKFVPRARRGAKNAMGWDDRDAANRGHPPERTCVLALSGLRNPGFLLTLHATPCRMAIRHEGKGWLRVCRGSEH